MTMALLFPKHCNFELCSTEYSTAGCCGSSAFSMLQSVVVVNAEMTIT